jgi:hypothetical protein
MTNSLSTNQRFRAVIEKIERRTLAEIKQISLPISHNFDAGMYSRTVRVPAGLYITGALIKIPTQVVVSGKCMANLGDEIVKIEGYAVLSGPAGRKQIFVAIEDTYITMVFPSAARTVAEAEAEFTDQAADLNSRRPGATNEVIRCLE